ncbi:DEKNAAC104715 [Brettanomyces naardenensis]|uniref:DEKNAAC104715 n=1 Tax=Brettanomyces naardenensis TaxID=13370 RepID=A0A448YRG7_BRENA|nr:DEKNAAC104715 [Brettanomyces naardenensis]
MSDLDTDNDGAPGSPSIKEDFVKQQILSESAENDPESDLTCEEIPTAKELDKIYRHLDYRIIPALWCLYFLTSFGSSAYGNTLTMNYETNHSLAASLDLKGKDLSTASALYYVAYILFDLPMNLIMTKLSPQVWLCRIVVSVGVVYVCYVSLHNAAGIEAIRFMSGFVGSGTWPGMTYYISLWYPEQRTAKRIGYYFTAAQLSASAAGLVCAGFQKMDMVRGYYGWKWLYIVYGSVTIACGISLVWWLPDRPEYLAEKTRERSILPRFLRKYFTPVQPLTEREKRLHGIDMKQRYKKISWTFGDLLRVMSDARSWALIIMYFGVVGTGFGLAVFATTLIQVNNPTLSGINISLLYAPIWLFDLAAILLITPLADRYKNQRHYFFCGSTLIIIVGLIVTTFAKGPWNRWAGLLIAGFGLGPTVPICMTFASEIMTKVYGDVGCAAASALVSGLGNLGSVTSTYALYSGWPEDRKNLYRNSNMMLVVMCGVSILACIALSIMRKYMSEEPYGKQKLGDETNGTEESI